VTCSGIDHTVTENKSCAIMQVLC